MKTMKSITIGTILALALATFVSIPAQAATTQPSTEEAVSYIFNETNKARKDKGLPPLTLNSGMKQVAQTWTEKQAAENKMYHNPNYSSQIPAGWSLAAENVAMGYTYKTVTAGWLNSPGHYANIMSGANYIGIGVAYSKTGAAYYTQVFGKYSKAPAGTNTTWTGTPTTPTVEDFTGEAHVQNIGWAKGWGTTGKGLRLEALKITQNNDKRICISGHVQNIGWMAEQCTSGKGTSIITGTTGKALRLEALQIRTLDKPISAEAHVQNIGWMPVVKGNAGDKIIIGTSGKSLRMEAVKIN